MNAAEIVSLFRQNYSELTARFGVRALSLFGSIARQAATVQSDVDVLVTFAKPPGFAGCMALKWHLEELLRTGPKIQRDC